MSTPQPRARRLRERILRRLIPTWLQRQRQRIIDAWLARRVPPEPPTIELHRRRPYILPTRFAWLFALMLLALLLGAVNYETSLAFGATFLLAGIGVTGMIHTYRTLHGLRLRFGPAQPVFAGETAQFPVTLDGGHRDRWRLVLGQAKPLGALRGQAVDTHVAVPTHKRGRLRFPRTEIETTWPLDLFRVWSWVFPRVEGLVYPLPVDHGRPLPDQRTAGEGAVHARSGEEDFAGLREYHPGDPPRRVDWKAYARADELHTKMYESEAGGERLLDWHELGGLDTEARLQQIAHWILQLDARGATWALHLPDQTLTVASGSDHREACLQALAMHGEPRA